MAFPNGRKGLRHRLLAGAERFTKQMLVNAGFGFMEIPARALGSRSAEGRKQCSTTDTHRELMRSVTKFVEAEINPHAEVMGGRRIFPAHELFKRWDSRDCSASTSRKIRRAGARLLLRDGVLRVGRREQVGVERDGDRRADRHGDARARALRLGRATRGIFEAQHRRRLCCLHRRVRNRFRLRRRLDQDDGEEGRRRLRHQRRQDVDHQRHAGRLDVPARQHRRRAGPPQQVASSACR